MSANADDLFDEFVRGRSAHLFRMALLLAGDRAEAEDLLQIALERAWARRAVLVRDRSPEPYVRRILVNAAIDRHRWRRRRPEYLVGLEDREPAQSDHSAGIADRDLLMRGLASLPPRQRAVLVLRFWEDQDASAIASLLGCSVGTVKSQLSRGLARLRQLDEFSETEPGQRTAGGV